MNGLTVFFVLKWLALLIVLLGVSYGYSYVLEKLLKGCFAPAERFAAGFTALLAAVELTCWPMVAFRLPTALFMAVAGVVILLPAGYGFFLRPRPHDRILPRTADRRQRIAALLALAVVLVQIVMATVVYRSDADDSFYVSNVALFANSSVLNPYDSSMGNLSLGTVPMYDFQVWESLLAMACRVFGLSAASLTHTCIIPALLLLSASAYYLLGYALFSDRRKAWLFVLVLSVFHLFSGANDYSVGAFLLGRVWQGKATSLVIVLPVLSGLLLRRLDDREKAGDRLWLALALCMLAAIGLNPTGLYTVGFELLFLCAAVAIAKKQGRILLQMLPALAIAVVFVLLIYLRTRQFPGQIAAASTADAGFVFDQLRLFMAGQHIYFYLFLAVWVLLALFGDKVARTYFTLTCLLALLVWSPPTGRLVAQYLTKTPSYWRVFWLIPFGPAFAYCAVWGSEKLPKRKALVGILVCAVLIALPGTWVFQAPATVQPFISADNVEKVPDETLEFGKTLVERGVTSPILCCENLATTLRQVYPELELLVSRQQYILDLYLYRGQEEAGQDRLILRDFANGGGGEAEEIGLLLQKYGVQYVILEKEDTQAQNTLLRSGWAIVQQSAAYVMLSVNA
ncbi:MAG: DUF6077 domain-containing protein [Oscillospiraceae bacterium]|nr:DUF6077 domain-containing protein [Oscillospiraceae bacterium]